MKRRRFLQTSLVLPWFPLSLSACGRTPISVGLHPWPGYDSLLLARHFGWLGQEIQLSESSNAGESIAGLQDGRLHAACLTLDEALSVRASGVPLTVLLVMSESVGADAVLARPDIRHPKELKGKRLAVELSAVGALVLQKMLAEAGLSQADLELVDAPPNKHLALWQAGEIDAAITYSPFSSLLKRHGANILFDSRQFPNTIFDVLAVRQDGIAKRGKTLRLLTQAHFRALRHLRLNREDAMRRIAAWHHLSYEEVQVNFAGLRLPDSNENRHLLKAEGQLILAARHLSSLMRESDRLTAPDLLKDLVSNQYLPEES